MEFVEIKYFSKHTLKGSDFEKKPSTELIKLKSILAISNLEEFRLPLSNEYVGDFATLITDNGGHYYLVKDCYYEVKSILEQRNSKKVKYLDAVAEFHRTFNHPIESKPCIPALERCELRVNLLKEELNELVDAIFEKDIVEVADALADLQYVLSGAILEFGMSEKFDALFEEVQRSNMSKACRSIDEVEQTKKWYAENRGVTDFNVEQAGNLYIVKRADDGKILKNVNYEPAKLRQILLT